jgi:hypothetical protein
MGFLGKKKQRTFEEEQLSKGLIKSGDEWITPAEKFRRERTVAAPIIIKEVVKEGVEMVNCVYCQALMPTTSIKCPHCGAPRKK